LQLVAAKGLLPLEMPRMVAVQVDLALSEDEEVARTASSSLADLDPGIVADLLGECEDPRILAYFAVASDHDLILRAVIRNRKVRAAVLEDLAETLTADLQETLLLRQDMIIENPALLERLESNPGLSAYGRRKIAEYRDHLIPKVPEETPRDPAVEEPEMDPAVATLEESELAIEQARSTPGEGAKDELTGLSASQIKLLPMPVRLRLSYGASTTVKRALILDTSPMVAVSVLKNNSWSELEIERVAGNKLVLSEVLENLGRSRQWVRKDSILRALARNPRTPAAMALRFVPRLSVRELKEISRDHNTAAVIKTAAGRLYKMRRT